MAHDCPNCQYPTKGQYFGIYTPGRACDGCGYLDLNAQVNNNARTAALANETANYKRQIAEQQAAIRARIKAKREAKQ